MSSKKSRKKKTATTAAAAPTTPSESASTAVGLWPEEFAAPRRAVIIAAAAGMLSVLWFALGVTNKLLVLEYIGAWWLGFYDFTDLGPTPSSTDLGAILAAFTLLFGGALIHPVVGLAVLAAMRPWLDGYTFPADNVYFLWGTILIFVLWGVRALLRGEALRSGPQVVLLLGFLFAQVIASLDSIQFADSYRQLLYWATYFFLFLLVLNCLKTDRAQRFLLFSVALVAGLQAAFAILQYFYIFPYLRVMLTTQPDLMKQFFGIEVWTPDLAHRFNVNRAFGTVLQPNTFAGLMILLLPHVVIQAIQNLRTPMPESVLPEPSLRRYQAIATGIAGWFIGTCVVFMLIQFPVTYAIEPLPGQTQEGIWTNTQAMLILATVSGGLLGLLLFLYVSKHGASACGRLLYRLIYPAAAVAMLVGLYFSFSRGGMLALAVATALTVLLHRLPETVLPKRLQRVTAVGLLLLGGLAFVIPSGAETERMHMAQASDGPAPGRSPAAPAVTQEGIDAELAGTESFMLRLTYWRVAARIFMDHPLTGVGPGAFDWAYPAYQRLGDGDVREAHNGYLQAFAESGILGGLLLLSFCISLVLYAAIRVIREEDSHERLLLSGLFAGMLAFLGHAFIDIDFQHPSLMFYFFLLAGLFLARASLKQPQFSGESGWRSYLLLPLLAIAALTVGASMRVYGQDLALSRMQFMAGSQENELNHRYEVGRFFLESVPEYARGNHNRRPSIPVRSARVLIRDLEELEKLGKFHIRNPNTSGSRRLGPGELITDDAILVPDRYWDAFGLASTEAVRWLAELENIDRKFPHDPKLANHLANWYWLLADQLLVEREMHLKRENNAKQIYWIEKALDRSPMYADLYVAAAQAYWRKGTLVETPEERREAFAKALEYAEGAPPLAPTLPHYEYMVAEAYDQLASFFDTPETQDQKKRFTALGQEHRNKGDKIYHQRNAMHLKTPMPQYGPKSASKKEAS